MANFRMGQGGTVRTNNVTLSMDKLQKIHPSTKIDMIPGFLKGEKGIGGFPNFFLKFTPYQAKTSRMWSFTTKIKINKNCT